MRGIFQGAQEMQAELEEYKYRVGMARDAVIPAILALSHLMEGRDAVNYGHSRRVARVVVHFVTFLEWPADQIKLMNWVGLLHDLGKIIIPDSVLLKQGKFTEEEFETMKLHSATGARILNRLSLLGIEAEDWTLYHHEKWDGSGYPDGLKAKDIPIGGRILAMADAYDAMTATRRYREKIPHWMAVDEIVNCGGRQFDPELVSPFAEAFKLPLDEETVPQEPHFSGTKFRKNG